jgi:hypothetical protein
MDLSGVDVNSLLGMIITFATSRLGNQVEIALLVLYIALRLYDRFKGPIENKYLAAYENLVTSLLHFGLSKVSALASFFDKKANGQ